MSEATLSVRSQQPHFTIADALQAHAEMQRQLEGFAAFLDAAIQAQHAMGKALEQLQAQQTPAAATGKPVLAPSTNRQTMPRDPVEFKLPPLPPLTVLSAALSIDDAPADAFQAEDIPADTMPLPEPAPVCQDAPAEVLYRRVEKGAGRRKKVEYVATGDRPTGETLYRKATVKGRVTYTPTGQDAPTAKPTAKRVRSEAPATAATDEPTAAPGKPVALAEDAKPVSAPVAAPKPASKPTSKPAGHAMLSLPANVAEVARVAPRDAGRFATNNVHVEDTGTGYRVEATDGKRLVRVEGPGRSEGVLTMLKDAPNSATSALLPAKRFAEVVKGAKKDAAHVVLSKDVCTFATAKTVSAVETGEGRFPNADRVMPEGKPVFFLNVDAKLLAELLTVASAFTDPESNHRITLNFFHPEKPFTVETANPSGQKFTGLFMPLS